MKPAVLGVSIVRKYHFCLIYLLICTVSAPRNRSQSTKSFTFSSAEIKLINNKHSSIFIFTKVFISKFCLFYIRHKTRRSEPKTLRVYSFFLNCFVSFFMYIRTKYYVPKKGTHEQFSVFYFPRVAVFMYCFIFCSVSK